MCLHLIHIDSTPRSRVSIATRRTTTLSLIPLPLALIHSSTSSRDSQLNIILDYRLVRSKKRLQEDLLLTIFGSIFSSSSSSPFATGNARYPRDC